MICLELNYYFYDPSRMLQLFEFVRTLRSSIRVGFNNFLLIDKSKISSDHQRSLFANTLFNDNSPNNVQAISETFKKIFNYVRVEMFSNNAPGCRL